MEVAGHADPGDGGQGEEEHRGKRCHRVEFIGHGVDLCESADMAKPWGGWGELGGWCAVRHPH